MKVLEKEDDTYHPIESLHPNGTKLWYKCILDKFFVCTNRYIFSLFATTSLL